jgi:hypothetical protein
MAGWTLSDIQTKVRNITGSPSTDQLSTADLNNYINNYYVFTMPFELKEQIQLEFIKFNTLPNIDVYAFPGNFLTDQPMCYADGFPLIFYQDPDIFYQDWPIEVAQDSLATGDGVTSNFTGSLYSPPVLQSSLLITDGSQIVEDDGAGLLTGDGAGTIDYVTGAFNVTFTAPSANGATIYAKYQGYQPTRPQGVLFFNNEFTFRPVPDQVYQIQMQGYINPTVLSSLSDTPMQQEWGQVIAYGAALDIFADRGDLQKYAEYSNLLKRFENVALARTIQQFQAEQSVPRF